MRRSLRGLAAAVSSGDRVAVAPGGSAEGTLELRKLEVRKLDVTNVSRIVSLGSSIYRILRRLEAPGRPDSHQPKIAGGSPLKPFARLRGLEIGESGGWK